MAVNCTPVHRVSTMDYFTFAITTYESNMLYLQRYWNSGNYSLPLSFLEDCRDFSQLRLSNFVCVIILAICFTLLRVYFAHGIILPLARYFQIPASAREKAPESAWKLIFYLVAWLWSFYVVIWSGRYTFFSDPLSAWDGFKPDMDIPWDITVSYLVQSAFYLHSIYGTLYLDIWRKDSVVMLVHHVLTLTLLGFSYAVRRHNVGALVLLLHDISDVALEFTKLNVYMKNRGGRYRFGHDLLSTVGFAVFALSWFVFRLYWYPLKVLYVTQYGAACRLPYEVPFIPAFNIMLWILLGMNTYWFHFILLCLYKVLTGQLKEIDDTREYEQERKLQDQNGVCDSKRNDERNGHIVTKRGAASFEDKRPKED